MPAARRNRAVLIGAMAAMIASSVYAAEPPAPVPDSDPMNIKEIDRTSRIALKVLDKNCPDLVQPYKLSDNAASLALFKGKERLIDSAKRLKDTLFRKPRGTATFGGELSEETRNAAKQLNWLPMSAELVYGERSHEMETNLLDRDSKLGARYYPIADGILDDLLSHLSEPHDYEFRLFILKNSTHNALARPGGFLYIDQGLLESDVTLPKASFALAHEIAHVLQRHETKALQSMVVDSFTAKDDLLKAMTTSRYDPSVVLSRVKVGKDVYARHYSDQELQSDSCAARLLARVHPHRAELVGILDSFLQDLDPAAPVTPAGAPTPTTARATSAQAAKAERTVAVAQDIVTTPAERHPTTKERTQNLRAMLHELTADADPSAQR